MSPPSKAKVARRGHKPLGIAVKSGDIDAVKALLAEGQTDPTGNALFFAARRNFPEIAELLIPVSAPLQKAKNSFEDKALAADSAVKASLTTAAVKRRTRNP